MGLTKLDSNRTLSATRQDYTLPTCALSGAPVTYRGNDFSNVQEMEIDISGQAFTLTRATATGYNGTKIIDFPAGHVTILSAFVSGPVTTGANSGADEDLSVALGTAATADATLNGSEVNVMAAGTVAIGSPLTARTGVAAVGSAAASGYNGVTTPVDLFLNMAQGANVSTGDSSVTFGTGSKIVVAYQINVA